MPRVIVASMVLVALVGCGGSDRSETVPVQGQVLYRGQPVAEAQVMFLPENDRPANATTDAEGKFVLTTFETGDGAVVGAHRVSITKMAPRDPQSSDPYAMPKSLLPPRYGQPMSSGLTAEVTSSGPNDFTFELID